MHRHFDPGGPSAPLGAAPMASVAHRDRGQVVPILAVVLVLAGLVGAGVAGLAAADARWARAQAAADAVALAGAADGRPAAEELAAANQARVVRYRVMALDVEVTVTREGVTATARARWGVGPPTPP